MIIYSIFRNGEGFTFIRLVVFVSVFIVIGTWELLAPRRCMTIPRVQRWFKNIGIMTLGTVLVRLILPVGVVGIAVMVHVHEWGLLNNINMPYSLKIIISLLILDYIIYLQHVMFHKIQMLWHLHKIHHTDIDYDLTTGIRFHPLEILISIFIKMCMVMLIGTPVLVIVLFEIILNASSIFNHGNVQIPVKLDQVLRWILVTPDMHRVHHSVVVSETNSNYGFNLPWWDHLCGTYRNQPTAGHEQMIIGLNEYRDDNYLTFFRLIILPFFNNKNTSEKGGKYGH